MGGNLRRAFAPFCGVSVIGLGLTLATPVAAQTVLLDAITIIATKIEESAIHSLAPVSTIRQDQIQQIQPTRTNQIFFGIPGVSTEATAQDPSVAINIRGLQDFGRVAVTIDGARQNYARLGHNGAGSFFLESEVLADVDIVRGPSSNINGSGAIGGVVAFRTKDVNDVLLANQPWGIQANVTGGTNGFNSVASIFAASRVNPNVEYIIGGSTRDQGDYRTGDGTKIINSGQNVDTFLSKATFRPADDHQIKLSALVYNADWINGGPSSTASAARDFNSLVITTSANWKYRPVGNQLFDFDGTIYWNRTDVTTFVLGPAGVTYGPVGTRTNYLIDTTGFDTNNTSRFEVGGLQHAFTYGVDLFRDAVDNHADAGTGALFNPTGVRLVYGGFVQLKSNYSTWLEVITGLRYDNYSLESPDASASGDRVSPKITIGVTPFAGFQPYVSYAEGYRAPAVTETLVSGDHPPPASFTFIPNPNLRPEVGKNKEFGINIKRDDWLTVGDKLRIKTSYFRNDVDDFIDTAFVPPVPPCPNPVFCAQYQNVASARIEGFEFEATYDRGDWFVGLAGSKLHGRNLTNGQPLAKVPADMLATTLGARFLERKLQVAVRWAAVAAKSAIDLPAPGTGVVTPVGSYNLVNLYVGYEVDPTLLLAFSVENLLNEQYTVYTHEFASPGITAKLSLRKTFGPAPDLSTVNNLNTANLRPASTVR
jgi:hemoglobin/transferrin/lactoferrin receptor protein